MRKAWTAMYHSEVEADLLALGIFDAAKIFKIIDSFLQGTPMEAGQSLAPLMPGFRLLKSDSFHILFEPNAAKAQVFVWAIRKETGLGGTQKAKTHRGVG